MGSWAASLGRELSEIRRGSQDVVHGRDVPPSGSMSMTDSKRLTQAVDGPRLLMISAITGASHTGPVAALRNRAIVEAV